MTHDEAKAAMRELRERHAFLNGWRVYANTTCVHLQHGKGDDWAVIGRNFDDDVWYVRVSPDRERRLGLRADALDVDFDDPDTAALYLLINGAMA